jgi:hypothetical protein
VIWGAIAGGFAGTLVLTTGLRAASELKLTRMDLPFLLGTVFTDNRARAKAVGYLLHFGFGIAFALGSTGSSVRSARAAGGRAPCSAPCTGCSRRPPS